MYVKLQKETGEKIVTTWLEIKINQTGCKMIKQKSWFDNKKNSPEHTCDKHENKYHIYRQPDHNQSPCQWFYRDKLKITRSRNYNHWHEILQNNKEYVRDSFKFRKSDIRKIQIVAMNFTWNNIKKIPALKSKTDSTNLLTSIMLHDDKQYDNPDNNALLWIFNGLKMFDFLTWIFAPLPSSKSTWSFGRDFVWLSNLFWMKISKSEHHNH